jgi:Uma2 family endonuclease
VSRARPLGRPATWEDLDLVPEHLKGELVGGEIIAAPRPGGPHQYAAAELSAELFQAFRRGRGGPGGWIILPEPYVRFGTDIRSPDLVGWRADRYSTPRRGPFEIIPDWVCEALSPRTAKMDRTEKMPLYAAHGVKHMWLVDPEEHILEVYRLQGEKWLLLGAHGGDDKVRAEPFDAIELELSLLWAPMPPEPEDE